MEARLSLQYWATAYPPMTFRFDMQRLYPPAEDGEFTFLDPYTSRRALALIVTFYVRRC